MSIYKVGDDTLVRQCLQLSPHGVLCKVWDNDSEQMLCLVSQVFQNTLFPFHSPTGQSWSYAIPVKYPSMVPVKSFDGFQESLR